VMRIFRVSEHSLWMNAIVYMWLAFYNMGRYFLSRLILNWTG
jgi:hypothetical protein